jgi:hypothetical protein
MSRNTPAMTGTFFTSPLAGEVGDNAFRVDAGRGVFAAAFHFEPPSLTLPLKGGGDMSCARRACR